MEYRAVLDYWFGQGTQKEIINSKTRLWWHKDETTDADIRQRFGSLLQDLAGGTCSAWLDEPETRLAWIVTADQFSRNIHRGHADSFALDPQALQHALDGIERKMDQDLMPIQRVFFYMPLEHSESAVIQQQSVRIFQGLLDSVTADLRPGFESYLEYARRHQEIIDRFGRFPHRNSILGRTSTPGEIEYLKSPGSGF
ncbi:MAG: DUF924 domain-containing protein [Proteobacteria bacterium]|nr:DUF924 domain-containing protein [Pseudomonadota bacterium]